MQRGKMPSLLLVVVLLPIAVVALDVDVCGTASTDLTQSQGTLVSPGKHTRVFCGGYACD